MEVAEEDNVRPDVYSFTAAISACERGGEAAAALETFRRMQASGISPNEIAYNAAIRACATPQLWPVALSLLDDMSDDGVERSVVSFNAALVACERGGGEALAEAELLLDELAAEVKISPDLITYHTAIACMRRAATQTAGGGGGSSSSERKRSGSGGGGGGGGSSKRSDPAQRAARRAVRLVQEMMRPSPGPALTPSVIGFTGAMSACNAAGYWRASLALFGRMERSRVAADTIAQQQALVASAGGGYWQTALRLLSRLHEERKQQGVGQAGTLGQQVGAARGAPPPGARGSGARGGGGGARGGGGRGGAGRRPQQYGSPLSDAAHADALQLGAVACKKAGEVRLAAALERRSAETRRLARTAASRSRGAGRGASR